MTELDDPAAIDPLASSVGLVELTEAVDLGASVAAGDVARIGEAVGFARPSEAYKSGRAIPAIANAATSSPPVTAIMRQRRPLFFEVTAGRVEATAEFLTGTMGFR